jgi:tetratricopeptide (TPR) repeat protein
MKTESLMENLCKNLALELLPKVLPIPAPITTAILETLIGLLDQEQKNSEQLRKLIGSYYKTGMEYLTDAKYIHQAGRRAEWIQRALDRFMTASEVEEKLLKAKSQFFVGVCYDLLDERDSATRWYEKGYESASQQLDQLKPSIAKAVELKLVPGAAAIGGAIVFGLMGGPAMAGIGARVGNTVGKTVPDYERQKIQTQLEEIRHFMDPLSQVLLAHGSTIISQLGTVQGQVHAIVAQAGRNKEQWNQDGLARIKAGRYQEAIDEFDFALLLDPYFTLAYNNRGLAYINLKQYQRAIADFNYAIQLNPQLALAYKNRGVAYVNLKEYQRAIADYDRVTHLQSRHAEAYNLRGVAYFGLKEYQKAIADFNYAIQLNPQFASAYKNRDNAYEAIKKANR